MSAEDTEPTEPTEAAAPRSKLPRLAIIALLLGSAGAGAAWYTGWLPPGGAPSERPEPTIYYTLEGELVVNFEDGGRVRYLQVGIDVMTHDAETIEGLKTHAAVVRNNLILLFSGRDYRELLTREGKESLRELAREEIRNVLESRGAASAVEEIFFTRFVMQ